MATRRVRLSVRNAKLEDAWSTGCITLFGIENWERLPEESRTKIMKRTESLAVLIRKEYDEINDESPDRSYSLLRKQVSERDMGRILNAELANIKNRKEKRIRSPLIIIDAEHITVSPKEMIAEQKRLWELKKAKMGKLTRV